MTIQNQLKLIPISEIKYTRKTRQRTDLTSISVFELALNIAQHGLLQNVGIKAETMEINFGERRLTAFKLLQKAFRDDIRLGHLIDLGLSESQAIQIQEASREKPLYESWTKIPARLIKGTDNLTDYTIEFIENVGRLDLPWQVRANAAYKTHKLALAAAKERGDKRWTDSQTASLLGISGPYFVQLVSPLREQESASKETKAKLQRAISESSSPRAALNAARTIKDRHGEHSTTTRDPNARLAAGLKKKTKPEPDESESKAPPIPIIQADFHDWASSYSGPPFNFIHCDFPYGLDFNTSQGMATSAATKQVGEYNDAEGVYWNLLETLVRSKLIDTSAHIMLWFSQAKPKNKPYRLVDATRKFISHELPSSSIQDFDMIWHCSDNLGTIPDAQRYGRRTYETAMLITLGDRKIVKPKALSFAAPRDSKIHRSQKPLSVLSHFFSMFVDESTNMLDPTCGSATSVIVAKRLKANKVLGLEINPETYDNAVKHYKQMIGA